jgi:hypothetical protein
MLGVSSQLEFWNHGFWDNGLMIKVIKVKKFKMNNIL